MNVASLTGRVQERSRDLHADGLTDCMSSGALCYVLTLDVRRIYYSLDIFAVRVVRRRIIPLSFLEEWLRLSQQGQTLCKTSPAGLRANISKHYQWQPDNQFGGWPS